MIQFSKFKILFLLILFFSIFGFAKNSLAATYYADNTLSANCTGNYSITNRTCTGSDGNAYTTAQSAVDAANNSGDIVYLRAGLYNEVIQTAASGTSGNHITISAYSTEIPYLNALRVSNNYLTINGLKLGAAQYLGAYTVLISAGVHDVLLSNGIVVNPQNTHGTGFYFTSDGSPDGNIYNITISGWDISNIIDNIIFQVVGYNNLITENTIHNTDASDLLYCFGHDNTFSYNYIHDTVHSAGLNNHDDLFQTFGQTGLNSYNNTFANNYIYNWGGSFCQMVQQGNRNIRNWTIKNNIFNGVVHGGSFSIENSSFYNNTFINVSTDEVTPGAVYFGYPFTGSQMPTITSITAGSLTTVYVSSGHGLYNFAGYQVYLMNTGMASLPDGWYAYTYVDANHVMIAVDTTGQTYGGSGGIFSSISLGSDVRNNIFVGVSDPARATYGWYSFAAGAIISASTFDYNYVASNAAHSYSAKTNFQTGDLEAHGVNGGNPYFVNDGGTAASDYALTALSTILIGKGANLSSSFTNDYSNAVRSTWDIGAYEYVGASDTTPPAAPSGLSVS
jgi:hypothetical protein